MLARNLWSRTMFSPSFYRFSTQSGPKRFFMVEYVYNEDAYYKKSKLTYSLTDLFLVPHRENHLKALESLKQTADAKLISSPFFPDNGSVVLVQSEANEDPMAKVEAFVKADPYVLNNIVADY